MMAFKVLSSGAVSWYASKAFCVCEDSPALLHLLYFYSGGLIVSSPPPHSLLFNANPIQQQPIQCAGGLLSDTYGFPNTEIAQTDIITFKSYII